MSGSWLSGKLGDFITLQRGYDLPAYNREPGTIPVVTSSGISDTHSIAKANGPGVVMGRYGTIGEIFYVETDFWPHNTSLFVKDFKGNDPRFVYYFLKTLHYQAHNDKTSVPGLNRNDLHMIDVLMPLPDEQRAIAHILGSLDDKIEANRRMNETLEATARAIFKSWFVDFDPVHYKSRGEQPPGMDAETAALFPETFEESALGWIPQGWEVKPLSEAIQINPPRRLRQGELAPYLAMDSMPTSSARATEWIYREAGSGARFMNGDVLFARITPCLENGKTAFVDFLEKNEIGWGSTEYIIMRSGDELPLQYAYFVARNPELREYAIRNMSGTSGRQRVSASTFDHFLIVTPNIEVAAHFGRYVGDVFAKMKATDEESRTLAETWDSLLPKLISGEVRVDEVEDMEELL